MTELIQPDKVSVSSLCLECWRRTRADITILADTAEYGFTAINAGLSCLRGIVWLPRIVGQKRAQELIITGRVLTAQEALDWGLVNRVVPLARLQEEAMKEAKLLAFKTPLGVWFTKRAAIATRNMGVDDAEKFLNEHFNILTSSDDAIEGMNAFKEKRTPNYKFPYEIK